jgi:hypothetical protein
MQGQEKPEVLEPVEGDTWSQLEELGGPGSKGGTSPPKSLFAIKNAGFLAAEDAIS